MGPESFGGTRLGLPLVARAGKAAVRFRRLSSFCGLGIRGIRSASGARILRSASGARLQSLDEIKAVLESMGLDFGMKIDNFEKKYQEWKRKQHHEA